MVGPARQAPRRTSQLRDVLARGRPVGPATKTNYGNAGYKNIVQITIKEVANQCLHVMRRRPERTLPARRRRPAYSPRATLAATAVLLAAVAAVLVAATHPVVATAAVAGAVAWSVVRRLGRRRHGDRTRRLCVPGTGVCVEV